MQKIMDSTGAYLIKIFVKNSAQIDRVEKGEEHHRANSGTEERNPDHGENRLFVTAPLPGAPVFFADHYCFDKLAIKAASILLRLSPRSSP